MNLLRRIKAELIYRLAVQKAMTAFDKTGECRFVMTVDKNRLAVLDKTAYRNLEKRWSTNDKKLMKKIRRECVFCTPVRRGGLPIPTDVAAIKKAAFLDWYFKKP